MQYNTVSGESAPASDETNAPVLPSKASMTWPPVLVSVAATYTVPVPGSTATFAPGLIDVPDAAVFNV